MYFLHRLDVVKICSPNEWKILECDEKLQTSNNKKTEQFQQINLHRHFSLTTPGSIQIKKCQLILEDNVTLAQNHPDAEVIIVDGSALVNVIQLKISKKLWRVWYSILWSKSLISKFPRIDLVLDVYKSSSINDGARTKGGFEGRKRVSKKVTLQKHFFPKETMRTKQSCSTSLLRKSVNLAH